MQIKKVVKRLIALGTGATMLGATVMGAMAADLSSYPSSFQTDGVFNGYFVVGEAAQPIDNLAMTDIATAMWYTKPSAASTTKVEGDAWQVGTSTLKFEMANNNASASAIRGENIYAITTYIGKDELKALGTNTYKTGENSYNYNQYLYFDIMNETKNEIVKYAENDKDVTDTYFFVESGKNIGLYKLEFSSTAESDVVDATSGSASTSGTKLKHFEDTKINLFGQEYTIVLARRPSTSGGGIKMTLMGGATSGTLLEGETQTYTLGGVTYDVALTYTDSTYAKFTVNGESTDKMQVGDTFKLKDGKEVGVSEVLYQSYAGGIHSANFFLGANKLVLEDDAVISDSKPDHELDVGGTTIDGADVIITGTDNNVTFKLSTIEVNMTAQDDYYIAANGKLSDAIKARGDDKEVLFTNNWEIEYKGLSDAASHEIKLDSSTDRKYKLVWYDGDNNKVDMPFTYALNTSDFILAEDASEKCVFLNETVNNITKNDYFVVTGGSAASGTAKSYALQYKGADKSTATSPKISFKNLGSGETLEYAIDTAAASDVVADIKLGGYTFAIRNSSTRANSDFTVQVDFDGDKTVNEETVVDIVDYYGATISFKELPATTNGRCLGNHSLSDGSFVELKISTPNGNDYDNIGPSVINASLIATTGTEMAIGTFMMDNANNPLLTPEGEQNIYYGYTSMGGKVTYETPTSAPARVTYNYPEAQRLPQLYVTSGAVTTSTSTGGDLALVQVVDATKLDTEVTTVGAQNLVIVGGPCVNSVAAKLLGNPADCTQGFSAGKARVKIFEDATTKKLAMLVAGYSGEDTRLAGKVIAHRYKELKGEEVEVVGTTYSDATIGAPTVVTEEAAATTATE